MRRCWRPSRSRCSCSPRRARNSASRWRPQLADDGLDEAVAALRAFALIDRETIADERDPSITTETIRLHRLVRTVAAGRRQGEAAEAARRVLIEAMAAVYPRDVYDDPSAWPRARRLDALALDLVGGPIRRRRARKRARGYLLDRLGCVPAGGARGLCRGAAALRAGAGDPREGARPRASHTATSLNNLALLLRDQGDLAGARPLFERALAIREKALGPEHPDTARASTTSPACFRPRATSPGRGRSTSARWRSARRRSAPSIPDTAHEPQQPRRPASAQGDLAGARPLYRAGAGDPREGARPRASRHRDEPQQPRRPASGPGRPRRRAAALRARAGDPREGARPRASLTATSLNNLARLLQDQGDLAGARPLFERALAIREKALGPEHPDTATSLNNLAVLLQAQGDLAGARPLYERALAIREKALGPEHPDTILTRDNLANLRRADGAPLALNQSTP